MVKNIYGHSKRPVHNRIFELGIKVKVGQRKEWKVLLQ
jgi:hypothetical protein